ncbi:efflux RND transporter periplasmic adaptor subunit [Cognaticolwellia beringensis]|uniref:Efflux transporter periplasmic adaptor subunit n=1 Tax=Cognaticolwellia beringensis TaxID=1967665 RepID=A0A222G5S3_9GAMM|nr:efflux RND transporter periplasmic adaptor subunit [Cognaticolwellia beringensis]ASP46943.1 efflux transporter periplasmic adaptor subunit [Cognaticolwellia beringensis]
MSIKDTSEQDIQIKKTTSPKKRWITIILTTIIIACVIWQVAPSASRWSKAEQTISLDRVRLATITQGDFIRDISVLGRVVAAVSPTVYSPADGTITLMIEAGNEVKQGQILAMLESPELNSRLFQQQTTLESLQSSFARQKIQAKKQRLIDQKAVDLANVKLVTANREKRRADLGYEKSAISQIDYEKAQDELEQANLQHKHAVQDAALNIESLDFDSQSLDLDIRRQKLLVKELQRQVDGLNIASPVNGIVGNLSTNNKTFLSKNQAILTIVDLSQFEVEIEIPESYADDLAIGMDVNIQFEQHPFRARLVTISPEILNNQVTGRVRFINEIPKKLRQNQRLNTQIILEYKENILQVQRGQFLESSGGRFAFRVNNGLAEKTAITTGARSLSHVEILQGLTLGDQIIISGTDTFNAAEQVLLSD